MTLIAHLAMIEQLWYTRSPVGLKHIEGHQVRAASPGARPLVFREAFKTIEGHLTYQRPSQSNAVFARQRASAAPVSLALRTIGGTRFLIHKALTSPDDGGGSSRFFFSHALCLLPDTFTARDAITLWRSAFWTRTDAGLPREQTELACVDTRNLLPDAANLPTDPRVVAHLPYLIQAFLTRRPDQPIYIAADPDVVVGLIDGLTLILPAGLLGDVTFSTYEPAEHIAKDTVTIAGTNWWHEHNGERWASERDDLPKACYDGRGLVLKVFQPEYHTPLPEKRPAAQFATFAASALARGELGVFKRLRDYAAAAAVNDVERFLLLTQALRETPARDTLECLLSDRALLRALIPCSSLQDSLLTVFWDNQRDWVQTGRNAVADLRQSNAATVRDALVRMADRTGARAAKLIAENHDTRHSDWLLDDVCRTIDPEGTARHAALLFQELNQTLGPKAPHGIFDKSVRFALLDRWRHLDTGTPSSPISEQALLPWLSVSAHARWTEAQELLQRNLPERWRVLAVRQALLEEDQLPSTAMPLAMFTQHASTLKLVASDLIHSGNQHVLARLFRVVRQHGAFELTRSWLVFLLSLDGMGVEEQVAIVRTAALTTAQMAELIADQRFASAAAIAITAGQRSIIEQFVDSITLATCHDVRVTSTIDLLSRAGILVVLNPSTVEQIHAWRDIVSLINDDWHLDDLDCIGESVALITQRFPAAQDLLAQKGGLRLTSSQDLEYFMSQLVDSPAVATQAQQHWAFFVRMLDALELDDRLAQDIERVELYHSYAKKHAAPRDIADRLQVRLNMLRPPRPLLMGSAPSAHPEHSATVHTTSHVPVLSRSGHDEALVHQSNERRLVSSTLQSGQLAPQRPLRQRPVAGTVKDFVAGSILPSLGNGMRRLRSISHVGDVPVSQLEVALRDAVDLWRRQPAWIDQRGFEETIDLHVAEAIAGPLAKFVTLARTLEVVVDSGYPLSTELREPIDACVTLANFLEYPSSEFAALETVMQALRTLGIDGKRSEDLFQTLGHGFLKTIDSLATLRRVLQHFSDGLGTAEWEIVHAIIELFWRNEVPGSESAWATLHFLTEYALSADDVAGRVPADIWTSLQNTSVFAPRSVRQAIQQSLEFRQLRVSSL